MVIVCNVCGKETNVKHIESNRIEDYIMTSTVNCKCEYCGSVLPLNLTGLSEEEYYTSKRIK